MINQPRSRRAAIYTRISNDEEGRAVNVATQEKDCRALAHAEDLLVTEVYCDNDISASTRSRKPRPGYLRMLDGAEAGQFDVVIAYSISRLTRRPREIEDFIELNQDFGTQLSTVVSGRPDLSTADGRMTTRLTGNVDTAEAERTAERARRKQRELAESGRHNGPRPYGWDIVGSGPDQHLVINPAEAAVLRECVDRVLSGDGIWKLCRDLNDRDVVTSTGRPWVTQVLRRVLLRPRNYGMRSHRPLDHHGQPSGRARLYLGQWEPIIDAETHGRVVAVLTDPTRRTNNRGTSPKYLLTSLASCGECGNYVVGTNQYTHTMSNGRTRTYPHSYRCPQAGCMKVNRRMVDVDDHVNRVVLGVLKRDGVRLLGGNPVEANAARERIAALRAQLDIAADRFADGEWTDEQVSRINSRLRPQLQTEQARLRAAQPEAALARWVEPGLAAAWSDADIETRKQIIRLIGMVITIHRVGPGNGRTYDPESVTIAWSTDPQNASANEVTPS